jgi:hypothetical protein
MDDDGLWTGSKAGQFDEGFKIKGSLSRRVETRRCDSEN